MARALRSSAGPLSIRSGELITGNDAAFRSKLDMIKGAERSIDAMSYLFDDDYSSSVFAKAIVDAAGRGGVHVRLLVDYHTNQRGA